MSHLKAGDPHGALVHAQLCLAIGKTNSGDANDMFYAFEVLAHVERARGNRSGFAQAVEAAQSHFAQLSEEN